MKSKIADINLEIRLRGEIPQDPNPINAPDAPNLCSGCGQKFDYIIHDHLGGNSCSIECDEIIDDIYEHPELIP